MTTLSTIHTPGRTLPVAVHPGPDETFHSWLLRLSSRLNLEPLATLRSIGYLLDSDTPTAFPGYGIVLNDDQVGAICHATRVDPDQLRHIFLSAFDGGPLSLSGIDLSEAGGNRALGMREWVALGTSSACIPCLLDLGYQWQAAWRFPWTTTCLTHHTLLTSACPGCGLLFNAGRRRDNGLGPATNRIPKIDRCTNSIASGRRAYAPHCDHPYAQIPTVPMDQPFVLAAQQQIHLLLSPEHRQQHREWWQDLRAVTATLLTHGHTDDLFALMPGLPEESVATSVRAHFEDRDAVDAKRAAITSGGGDHRAAPRRRTHLTVPTDPALMAAVLPISLAVLHDLDLLPEPLVRQESASPFKEGAGLEAVSGWVRQRGHHLGTELLQRRASPELIARTKTVSGYNALTARHNQQMSDGMLDTRHIPRLFPRADYQPVADIVTATGTTDDYARAYLSLCAAKLVTGGTWQQAAKALGADPRKAVRNANAVTTRLTGAGELESIHHHVTDWVAQQSRKPATELVDYRAERDWHANHLLVSHTAAKRVLEPLGLSVTQNRRRCLAIRAWHEEALEPLAAWPGWVDCANVESAKEMYRRYRQQSNPAPMV